MRSTSTTEYSTGLYGMFGTRSGIFGTPSLAVIPVDKFVPKR